MLALELCENAMAIHNILSLSAPVISDLKEREKQETAKKN